MYCNCGFSAAMSSLRMETIQVIDQKDPAASYPEIPEDLFYDKLETILKDGGIEDVIDAADAHAEAYELLTYCLLYMTEIEPHYDDGHLKPMAEFAKALSVKTAGVAQEMYADKITGEWVKALQEEE